MNHVPRARSSPRTLSSRLSWWVWVLRLAVGKMREGPVPWLRAVRRGLFDSLPGPLKAAIARRRYRIPHRKTCEAVSGGAIAEHAGEVSVILPVYNQADLLEEGIESVLAQTRQNLELIVLNDGSTDRIDEVLRRFHSNPRVRILSQKNLGLPNALTNGFRFARGEYRYWTSADNVMEPVQLERLVEFLGEHPTTAMVYANYRVIGPDGEPLKGSNFRPQNRTSPDSATVTMPRGTETLNLLQDNFIGACFLYRGWIGRCLGSYSQRMGIEDYDYWMRLNAEFKIEHIGTDELLYRYRWHENSLSAKSRELKLFQAGQELMRHERERAQWRTEAWRIHVDQSTRAWCEGEGHDTVAFVHGLASSEGKNLAVLAANTLAPGDLQTLPSSLVIALNWSSDPTEVYSWADQLRDPRLLHFADNSRVLLSLALFTDRAFPLEEGHARLEIALAYGNEFVCAHRSSDRSPTPLPGVWSGGRRRNLLLQTDRFEQGGLECVVLDLARTLQKRGFDTKLLVFDKDCARKATEVGCEVLDAPPRSSEAYGQLLEHHGIDLVLAHHSLFGAEAAHSRGTPFVQTLHNTYHWFYPEEIEAWRAADQATTAYIHVSANAALYAHEKIGIDIEKSIIVQNGVRLPSSTHLRQIDDMRAELGLDREDFVFLNVASIYPPKAQTAMAHALAEARTTDPSIRIVVLGSVMNEQYASELNDLLVELNLTGAMILAGYHSDPEPFYAMANALVLPSYWEGCSLAVAEALVRNLPCVLTEVGAARQQVQPREGILIAPPFGAIQDMDFGNLKVSLQRPRRDFTRDLATALLAARHIELPPDPARAARFDIEGVADRYARILAWLQDGGRPDQARPFAWAGYDGGELV